MFEEIDLQAIPGFFGLEHIKVLEFLKKGSAYGVEIGAAQVVEIGVAEYFLEAVLRALGDFCSHDHTANAADIAIGETELGQVGANDITAQFFVIFVVDRKAGIVEKRGGFQQHGIIGGDIFEGAQLGSYLQHVERVVQAVVREPMGKLALHFIDDKFLGCLVVHKKS